MSDPIGGYLAVGRDLDQTQPWTIGEIVDIYRVEETVDAYVANARDLMAARSQTPDMPEAVYDLDAYGRASAKTLESMLESIEPPPRVHRQWSCTCSAKGRRTPLVKAYAVNGSVWVWVKGNRLPHVAKGRTSDDLHEADTAWPLHQFELLKPRVTYCRSCSTYWGVYMGNGYTENG